MKDFDKAIYEGTVIAMGKILAKYNAFSQAVIMRDVGKELIGYLKKKGFWFEEDGSLGDLNRTVELFLSHGFAEKLEVKPAKKGDYYIWEDLFLLEAYKELQDATGSPFLSCPMNLCLNHLCSERGKYFHLLDKSFDIETRTTVSNWELIDAAQNGDTEFDPLVIENAKLVELAEERANKLEAAQKQLEAHAEELLAAKQRAELQAHALEKQAVELAHSREMAECAAEIRARFLANMSHEIRTPMNGVIAMASLLSETELDASQKELVNTINASGNMLLSIINDVLDLSRIEAGKVTLDLVPFCVQELLTELNRAFRPQAAFKDLTFECLGSKDLPSLTKGDLKRIRQVLFNLIGNAIKFTEKGEVMVNVECRPGESGKRLYEFSVTDTGIGIQPAFLSRLFEPFSRLGKVGEPDTTIGTGLGLSICKLWVESMGGTIEAASSLGKGSRFRFTLELEDAKEEDLLAVPSTELPSIRKDLRVLLAEDNKTNQRIVELVLQKTPIQLEIAGDGLQAWERNSKTPYDLILMDCKMPIMDGFGATRKIRHWEKENGHPPCIIIAMTAHALEGDFERCIEAGMDDYLSKPVRPELLIQTIAKWQ